jgi:nucleoid DNA-binding protein
LGRGRDGQPVASARSGRGNVRLTRCPLFRGKLITIDDLFEGVTRALLRGETVVLPLVCNLKVKPKAARPNARDPRTGAPINVPVGEVVKLSPFILIKSWLTMRPKGGGRVAIRNS